MAVEPASSDGPPLSGDDATVRDGVAPAPFEPVTEHQHLGRYLVLGRLGHGGMGTVYEAFDRTLDRRIALKVLRGDVGRHHAERLQREAQALARLSHPNVVHVYEVGEAGSQTFIAMELVRGQTLRQWAQQQPPPAWRECVRVYLQAGEGLAAAHAEGLIHRDFKPSNAVIDEQGRVRVLDFGLARQAGDESSESPEVHADPSPSPPDDPSGPRGALDTPLTQTGMVMGTPAYMPLEQLRGQHTDARSDQFSFCVALYEALYGERPFEGDSAPALLLAVSEGRIRPPARGTTVPARLRQLVLRGLATDPHARWPTMDALLEELRRLVMPKARRWVALGVVAGLGFLGVGMVRYAAVGFRCEGARDQLVGIWDDDRRQQVGEAILASGLSHAPDTQQRVEQRLDAYADAWIDKHEEICEATRVSEQQSESVMDLRMSCLLRRRLALRETTGVLMVDSEARVNEAMRLVDALPGLDRCDDIQALQAEVPPPEDPDVAAQVGALQEDLARARSLRLVGEYHQALELTEQVLTRATGLDYPPLLAEARYWHGQLSWSNGRYEEGHEEIEQAYVLAVENRHEAIELDAATHLIYAVGVHQAHHEAGLQWGITAMALARDPLDEARVLANIGSVLKSQGKLDEALEHNRRVLAIREEALGPDHITVASALNSIATVLRRQGELDEALETHLRSLAIREDALGPRHPGVASSLNNLSNVLAERGDTQRAYEALQRALEIREDALGPEHPKVATVLNNMGELLGMRGDHEAAQAHFERALEVLRKTNGPEHPKFAGVLSSMAEALEQQGDMEEARKRHEQSLALWRRTLGTDHPNTGHALISLAGIALAQSDPDTARIHAERAMAIYESQEVSPRRMARARFMLARTLGSDRKARTRARTLARQARDVYASRADPQLATVETWLSEHPGSDGRVEP